MSTSESFVPLQHNYVRLNVFIAFQIFKRYCEVHPEIKTWLKWSKFEERLGEIPRARAVFETAVEALGDDANNEDFFIAFAQFEERQKEVSFCRFNHATQLNNCG